MTLVRCTHFDYVNALGLGTRGSLSSIYKLFPRPQSTPLSSEGAQCPAFPLPLLFRTMIDRLSDGMSVAWKVCLMLPMPPDPRLS